MRLQGCAVTRFNYKCVIHHPIGRTAKIKGVGNIGHWFLVPIQASLHDALHAGNLQQVKDSYWNERVDVEDMTRLEFEKHIFDELCESIGVGIPDDVMKAILEYHR